MASRRSTSGSPFPRRRTTWNRRRLRQRTAFRPGRPLVRSQSFTLKRPDGCKRLVNMYDLLGLESARWYLNQHVGTLCCKFPGPLTGQNPTSGSRVRRFLSPRRSIRAVEVFEMAQIESRGFWLSRIGSGHADQIRLAISDLTSEKSCKFPSFQQRARVMD